MRDLTTKLTTAWGTSANVGKQSGTETIEIARSDAQYHTKTNDLYRICKPQGVGSSPTVGSFETREFKRLRVLMLGAISVSFRPMAARMAAKQIYEVLS